MPGIHLLSLFTVITFLISSPIQVHFRKFFSDVSSPPYHQSDSTVKIDSRTQFALSINLSRQNHRHDGKDNCNIKMDYQQAELSLIQK